MQSGTVIALIGIIMVILGVVVFYSIEANQVDDTIRAIKHGGTFVGLMGIGVIIAGLLLFLINRNTSSDQKSPKL